MAVIPIQGVGSAGINRDANDVILPPSTWSDGRNVRFDNGSVSKITGQESLYGLSSSITGELALVQYWPSPTTTYYIYGTQALVSRIDGDGNAATIGTGFSTDTNAKWQSTLFNGGYTVILNNREDAPQYITAGTTGAADETTLQTLPGWPTDLKAHVVRSAGFALIAGNLTVAPSGGIEMRQPGSIRISSQAAPGGIPSSWTIGTQLLTTADEFELASASPIQEIVELKGYVYVFTEDSIHRITLPTARQPTQAQSLNDGYGALATDCVLEFDGSLFAVDKNDIYTTDGSGQIRSVADQRIRDYFQNNLNPTHFDATHVVRNIANDEMWVCFPNLTSTGKCNEALIWNYRQDTWTIRDLPDTVDATVGPAVDGGFVESKNNVVFTSGMDLQIADTGYTFSGTAYESYVERTTLVIGDVQSSQWTGSVYPLMKGEGVVQFAVAGSNTVGTPPNMTTLRPTNFTIGGIEKEAYKVSPRSQGRFFNIRVSDTATNAWSLSGYSIEEMQSEQR